MPTDKGTKKHLVKYRWVITLAGALIIFATDVRKDRKQEELKSVTDSFQSVESTASIRHDIALLADRTRGFQQGQQGDATLTSESDIVEDNLTFIQDNLDNVATLLRIYPDLYDPSLKQAFARLEDQESKITNRNNQHENEIVLLDQKDADSLPIDKLALPGRLLSQAFVSTFMATMKLNNDAIALYDKVVKQTQDLEQQKKVDYERYKRTSLVLFSIGWGIGILGQLLGAETPESK
jgi:hypothetical protein